MNNFLLGALTAFLALTPEGNKVATHMGKAGGKLLKKMAKENGIDVDELFKDEEKPTDTTD